MVEGAVRSASPRRTRAGSRPAPRRASPRARARSSPGTARWISSVIGAPRGDAGAEVAAADGLQVAPVLDVDRVVEAVAGRGPARSTRRSPARRAAPRAGEPGSARIQMKTRIESPIRIGTSSSSRRTVKRSMSALPRRPPAAVMRSGSAYPTKRTVENGRSGRPGSACSPRRSSGTPAPASCARTARPGGLHDVAGCACWYSAVALRRVRSRRAPCRAWRRACVVVEARTAPARAEERSEEVVRIAVVTRPAEQVRAPAVPACTPAEVVGPPRSALRDRP